MLNADTIRLLLPLLIGLPLIAAILLPLFARSTASARRVAIGAALVHLLLTALVVESARPTLAARHAVGDHALQSERDRVFSPEFVPGDPGIDRKDKEGRTVRANAHTTTWELAPFAKDNPDVKGVQFFIGLDGLNLWLVALTSLMLVPVILISWDSIDEGAVHFTLGCSRCRLVLWVSFWRLILSCFTSVLN